MGHRMDYYKLVIWLIILNVSVPLCLGAVTIEWSDDNATWENITSVDDTEQNGYLINLQENTIYYFRAKNDTSNWVYFNQRTKQSGEVTMSSIAIIGFVTMISLLVLFLPKIIKRFSANEVLDTACRGGCIAIGIFLLTLVTAMTATVSDTFSLGLETEIFRFMWLLQKAGYLIILFVVLRYGKLTLDCWNTNRYNRKMGYE